MKRLYLVFLVALTVAGTLWLVAPGCGDDDGSTVQCNQTLCQNGHPACCPGGVRGTWNSSLRRCSCPGGDADANIPEVTPDETTTPDDTYRPEDTPREEVGPVCESELGGICNVVLQCGCLPGERCIIGSGEMEECYPAGTDPLDTLCPAGGDNCQPQAQCLGTDGVHFYCMQFCYTDDDCPPDRTCDYGTPWGGYRVCGEAAVTCDPFTGSGCATGEACVINTAGGTTFCTEAGGLAPRAECTSGVTTDLCPVGTECLYTDTNGDTEISEGDQGFCLPFCDLSGSPHGCEADETCVNLGHPTIGACANMG